MPVTADSEHRTPIAFRPDTPGIESTAARGADNRIWLHTDVLDGIEDLLHVSKRLAIVVQQLAAQGRTTIVKGCRAENSGWRRTPLGGGGHGMHYYLWWTPLGSKQAKSFDSARRGSIFLRDVRHHDNHEPLHLGEPTDYVPLKGRDINDDAGGYFKAPWTAKQKLFVHEGGPVRVVHGHPGSGKTMALWKAVEARTGDRTLYLSWSRALVEQAQARFAALASPESSVDARDFATFLGALCGTDIERLSLDSSRQKFRAAFDWWKIRDHLGQWYEAPDALHAELRAVVLGWAVSETFPCSEEGDRLSDTAYRDERADYIGQEASEAVLKSVHMSGWSSWFETVFPELAAARTALARLREGRLPSGFQSYDRIVVDEVQDLTLLESAVVVQFCRALASTRPHAPWLLMAFDDGQTVRPSGFHAGRLNDLLHRSLDSPKEFALEYNVRSPSAIAEVVDRASRLYKEIDKGRRPTDQQNRIVDQEIAARLVYVAASSEQQAGSLLKDLDELDDVAVVTPDASVPDWVPLDLRETVLTPESSKGLEYASVCVLNPGSVLKRLQGDPGNLSPFRIHEQRTAMDRLRVALSRASETLVFVDVDPDEATRKLSLELLGESDQYRAEDLVELFQDADASFEQRILARIQDARALVDETPVRAWQRSRQAMQLLGERGQKGSVDDEALQAEVKATVLTVAARRLVDEGVNSPERQEVVGATEAFLGEWGDKASREAFKQLAAWTKRRKGQPFDLLDGLSDIDDQDRKWLQTALPPMLQSLLQALHVCAEQRSHAAQFSGEVEDWLGLIGYVGDVEEEVLALRNKAFDILINAGRAQEAGKVLQRVESPDPLRRGLLLERTNQPSEAAKAFEEAGRSRDALRNWRRAGMWERAVELAEGPEKDDLEWLVEMGRIAESRPVGIQNRLTPQERKKLTELTNLPRARRKRGPRDAPADLRQEVLFGDT